MSKRVQETEKPMAQWLETFKTLSTVALTVIIALTGIIVTNQYNDRQLEISRNIDNLLKTFYLAFALSPRQRIVSLPSAWHMVVCQALLF